MLESNWFEPERVVNAICTEPAPAPTPGTAPVTVISSTASIRGVTIEKNPSVEVRVWPVPMPSIVMLTVLFGRPLIRAARGPPVVETPGSMATAYSALRETSGSSVSCSVVSVDDTAVDWVWTSSELALTSTVSVRAPISSLAVISPGRAESRRRSLATNVLKPVNDTVTV